jgi:hypothetical protein
MVGKNGLRTTAFERFGHLDMRAQAEVPSALGADTPRAARSASAPRSMPL